MIEFTLFKSTFDNTTERHAEMEWPKFVAMLEALSTKPGYKPAKGERSDRASPLISPAVFKKGELRRNVNVLYWGEWAAIDIDDYAGKKPSEVIESFDAYENVIYSTASSTRKKPKFRVVLPLTERVEAKKIKHFWYALNKEFNSLADPQTKDLARMFYIPGEYPGALNFFLKREKGIRLNPTELMAKHSDFRDVSSSGFVSSMSPEMQTKLAEYRASKLTNRNITWHGWRDCRFVNKNLVAEYASITGTGWYYKLYSIMTSIASRAVLAGYPITPSEISALCREIDMETGNWYKDRPLESEAERAIAFALLNVK